MRHRKMKGLVQDHTAGLGMQTQSNALASEHSALTTVLPSCASMSQGQNHGISDGQKVPQRLYGTHLSFYNEVCRHYAYSLSTK